jgi:hypothetical protein
MIDQNKITVEREVLLEQKKTLQLVHSNATQTLQDCERNLMYVEGALQMLHRLEVNHLKDKTLDNKDVKS